MGQCAQGLGTQVGGLLPSDPFPNWPTKGLEHRCGQGSSLPQASQLVLFPKCLLPLTSDFLRKWFSQSTYVYNKENVMSFPAW